MTAERTVYSYCRPLQQSGCTALQLEHFRVAWPVAATLSAADAADRTLLSGIAAAMVGRFSKSAGPYHMFQASN